MILDRTGVFTAGEVEVALELIDHVLNHPGQQDYQIFTACHDSSVAGYYCIGPTPMTASTFDLYWIAVDPAIHGRGIGKRLLEHAESRIAAQSGNLVVAETSSQPKYEATRQFYLHNRYAELARIRDYYRPGDDLVIYGKYLSQ